MSRRAVAAWFLGAATGIVVSDTLRVGMISTAQAGSSRSAAASVEPGLTADQTATADPATGTPTPSGSASASPTAPAGPSPSGPPWPTTATGVQARFTKDATGYLATRPGKAAVSAVNLRTGLTVRLQPTLQFFTASIVKVDILAALLLQAQSSGRRLTTDERALAQKMITVSDNDATSTLWQRIGGAAALARAHRQLGLKQTVPGDGTTWGTTRTTTDDQLRLLRQLVGTTGPLTAASRDYVLDLMGSVAADQRWGVSAGGSDPVLKNGWLPYSGHDGSWLVNSIGKVTLAGGDPALIAVLTSRSATQAAGIQTVERLAALAATAVGQRVTGG